jgi:hypothetical protein
MTQEQAQEFVTSHLESAINSDEHPTFLHFGWFNYDGGELGLNLCTGDQYSTVTVEFPFDPEAYALGATSADAREEYENEVDTMRHFDPTDFYRLSEDLKDFLADAVHVARRAQRALAERSDEMF